MESDLHAKNSYLAIIDEQRQRIFERYNIVSGEDLRAASEPLSRAHAAMKETTARAQAGTIAGIINAEGGL